MIEKKKPKERLEIDLTGPQGNAFYLLATAQDWGRQLGYSDEKIKELIEEMESSDYDHLVETFDKHFGHIVTLLI